MKIGIPAFCFSIFAVLPGFSQKIRSQDQSWAPGFLQVKEALNYGLVFRGPELNYIHLWHWEDENARISYEAQAGFSYLESRGIGALTMHLIPVRMSYLFKSGVNKKLHIGPYITGEYNYALYPDLQSGYSFWFTHYSLGGEINYPIAFGKHRLSARLRTSVLGLTSRPPVYRDPYFFDLSVGYALRYVHQDLQLGSWSQYNVSDLEIRWQPKAGSHIEVAYAIQYTGYYRDPTLTMIDQSVKIIFLKKSKFK